MGPSPVAPLALRKNKLQPSCDFCRKSKLRCDHAQPCGRCLRRRRDCIYSESPMTKRASTSDSPRLNATRTLSRDSPVQSSEGLEKTDDPLALLSHDFAYDARDDTDLGFMGETGHAAEIFEAGLVEAQQQDTDSEDKGSSPAQMRLRRICTTILNMLPDPDVASAIMSTVSNEAHSLRTLERSSPCNHNVTLL